MFWINDANKKPIETKHVCWYVTRTLRENHWCLNLIEVIEEWFMHPECAELKIAIRDEIERFSFSETDPRAATLILLKAAQDNIASKHSSKIV
jgi:hypothetical protein